MSIGITGASGLLGTALGAELGAAGARVVRIDRSMQGVDGLSAIVHLAGEPIAGRRWTEAHKREIRSSRVEGTARLCQALAACGQPPKVLLSGSAVGFYGDRGDEVLTEESRPGQGFLAEVASAWEEASAPARALGIRVVLLRTGLVMAREGGALGAMLPAFRAGLGGAVGGGEQWQPWIAIGDWVRAARHLLTEERVEGPVNLVSPRPVRQRELAETLGRVLRRPAVIPAPKVALRLAFGREMADELLLSSQRVQPARLLGSGFSFALPDLEAALRAALG